MTPAAQAALIALLDEMAKCCPADKQNALAQKRHALLVELAPTCPTCPPPGNTPPPTITGG